jgi:hypothetical protein
MSHPFEKMFDKALRKSSLEENLVLKEAQKLIEKGYRHEEVCGVLLKLEKSLIDDTLAEIVRETREEVCEDEE